MTDPPTYCPKCGKKKEYSTQFGIKGQMPFEMPCSACMGKAIKALKRKPK